VLGVEGAEAEVQVGLVRVRVDLARLRAEVASEAEAEPQLEPAGTAYTRPSVGVELHLRGLTVDEALERLDHHLDGASLAGLPWVHIVHGKGTGALRHAVRDFLRAHPLVRSYRSGEEGEGGDGVTVVTLV